MRAPIYQKNPRAHENKIGTSPPPNPNTPPRNFTDMEVFLQKEHRNSSAHKIGAAISGPRIADKNLKVYGHEDFSEFIGGEKSIHHRCFQLWKLECLNRQIKRLVYIPKSLFSREKEGNTHIHQRAFKVFSGDPFAQYWCTDFGLPI